MLKKEDGNITPRSICFLFRDDALLICKQKIFLKLLVMKFLTQIRSEFEILYNRKI